MKNKIKKSIRLLGIVLFLTTISCEKDSVTESEINGHSHGKGPNEVSLDFFKSVTKINDVDLFLKQKMNQHQMQRRNSSYSLSDFSIDTTFINQCILNDGGLSFSFRIYPTDNSESPNEVYNLVISKIDNEWETSIFLLEKNITPIDGELFSSIAKVYQSAGLPSVIAARGTVEYITRELFHCPKLAPCTATWCDLCPERCRTTEIVGYTIHTPEENDDLSLQDPIFNYNGGGGGAVINHPSPSTTPCEKAKSILESKPNFKTKVQNLGSPTNLALAHEKAVLNFDNEATPTEIQGNANNPSVGIPLNPVKKYISIAHNHPDIPPGTLSVFSIQDLLAVAVLLDKNKIDVSQFVAYLPTKKGTQYAFTIEDKNKLVDFFFYSIKGSYTNVNPNDTNKYFASKDIFRPIYRKYYDPDNSIRKIKETDTNNENVLKEFLNFMEEADLGITLLESTDNFESFKTVTKNGNNSPTRQNCQ